MPLFAGVSALEFGRVVRLGRAFGWHDLHLIGRAFLHDFLLELVCIGLFLHLLGSLSIQLELVSARHVVGRCLLLGLDELGRVVFTFLRHSVLESASLQSSHDA